MTPLAITANLLPKTSDIAPVGISVNYVKENIMVYVLSKEGKPLMPTKRHGKVRILLKKGLAKVVKRKPFTIKLKYETSKYTQPITLGIDSGYTYIGFSAVTDNEELISGEVTLLNGQVERLKERRMYRRIRRSNLRYRVIILFHE